MPIEEKSWKEIEEEYARRKQERFEKGDKSGHWDKCPVCGGTSLVTCPACKGLGRNMASQSRSSACPTCEGKAKSRCQSRGCQGGWVWVADKK
jgi:DnaJ-class molecular chaperone